MKKNLTPRIQQISSVCQLACISSFALIIAPCLFLISLLPNSEFPYFSLSLFFVGWLSWTFIEYMAHRFWMHGKGNKVHRYASEIHRRHHLKPHDRKVTALHRALLSLTLPFVLYLTWRYPGWLSLTAGIFFGFTAFCMLHYALHKSWSQRILPRMTRFHMYHHCRYAAQCYGVSVVWWDYLFKTQPPKAPNVKERICKFYFDGCALETQVNKSLNRVH